MTENSVHTTVYRVGVYFMVVVVLIIGALTWGGFALKAESDRRVKGERAATVAICQRAVDNRRGLVDFINFLVSFANQGVDTNPNLSPEQKTERHTQADAFRKGALDGLPSFDCKDLPSH